jgi:hypothetical protein
VGFPSVIITCTYNFRPVPHPRVCRKSYRGIQFFGLALGVFKKADSYVVRGLVPRILSVNIVILTGHKGRGYTS